MLAVAAAAVMLLGLAVLAAAARVQSQITTQHLAPLTLVAVVAGLEIWLVLAAMQAQAAPASSSSAMRVRSNIPAALSPHLAATLSTHLPAPERSTRACR
jgi:hypothetical protein